MSSMFLGVPMTQGMSALGGAEAIFFAPLGGLGADVFALQEAYREEAASVPYSPSHLLILDQALSPGIRAKHLAQALYSKVDDSSLAGHFLHHLDAYCDGLKAGDWKKVHAAQMACVDIVGSTPPFTWKKILDNLRTKRGWSLEGGLFATAQNPVTALRNVLGAKQIEEKKVMTGDFDRLSEDLLEQSRDRNRDMRRQSLPGYDSSLEGTSAEWSLYIFNQNSGGLPGSKMAINAIRRAKVFFMAGKIREAYFALVTGSLGVGYLGEAEALLELAEKLEPTVRKEDRAMWFACLKESLTLFSSDLRSNSIYNRIQMGMTMHLYPPGKKSDEKERALLRDIRRIADDMDGQPSKAGVAKMLRMASGMDDYSKFRLCLLLKPLHISLMTEENTSAQDSIGSQVDSLQGLIEKTFDDARSKKAALQRLNLIKKHLGMGNTLAVKESLRTIKRIADQENAGNVGGLINQILERI